MSLSDELTHGLRCNSIKDATTVTQKAVCLAAHPGRLALFPFVRWFEARYEGKYRFARLTFLFDIMLVGIAIGLGIVALAFSLWTPSAFADKIAFEADVAPHDIVSGAPSTLVIRYTNRTGEELRQAKLSFGFPKHFLLLDVKDEQEAVVSNEIDLGTIPVDGTGSFKIHGVMFGDVGGKQTFRSRLDFTHGDKDISGEKIDFHTFSPVRSTLALSLALPDKIVAQQPMEGTLTYRNTGEFDFPEITVEPEWPAGFTLVSADAPSPDGSFTLPAIVAGAEGSIRFRGVLGDASGDLAFVFHPSFTFGNDHYRQETLTHTATVVPLPLRVSHSVNADTIRPGDSVRVSVTYENVGDEPVTNARIGVESKSPFAKQPSVTVDAKTYPELAKIDPGERGTFEISIPLYSSISQSATSVYEHIPFVTRAFGTFDMTGVTGATSRDGELAYTMTSPIVLDSFARYAAPSGDQLGRGPLPPIVGETTKYWVFWNVRGTTNELTNVRLEGELGPNVSYTGRETVSVNGGVTYDAAENSMTWTSSSLSPTLSPSSKIVGIAFEVAVTPTEDQVGSVPTLLKNIRVTATDAVTGAFVSASGATITTNLPNDSMAAGNGIVE